MPNVSKVLIVGGGIGGLALSIGLRKAGIDVEIVEIKQQWTVYHVGIIAQSNLVRAMVSSRYRRRLCCRRVSLPGCTVLRRQRQRDERIARRKAGRAQISRISWA